MQLLSLVTNTLVYLKEHTRQYCYFIPNTQKSTLYAFLRKFPQHKNFIQEIMDKTVNDRINTIVLVIEVNIV